MLKKSAIRRSSSAGKQLSSPAHLGRATEWRLKDYSLAAAGLGALALAAPAHAGIVTTNPGLTFASDTAGFIPVPGYPEALHVGNNIFATAASSTASIRSSGASAASASIFAKAGGLPASVGQRVPTNLTGLGHKLQLVKTKTGGASNANFLGTNDLGFSITKGGVTHYGWASLTITRSAGAYTVTVNTIAIEVCPAQPIAVGQAAGGASCGIPTTPAPNSLWLLSLGVAGLAGLETLRRLRKTA